MNSSYLITIRSFVAEGLSQPRVRYFGLAYGCGILAFNAGK